jgi:hypothetical protein
MKANNQGSKERRKHGTKPAWLVPGALVWTETQSGSPIQCTVIKPDTIIEDEWLLNSPSHGYAIQRHISEIKPD